MVDAHPERVTTLAVMVDSQLARSEIKPTIRLSPVEISYHALALALGPL